MCTAIKASQKCWSELYNEIHMDSWGAPYRILVKSIGRQQWASRHVVVRNTSPMAYSQSMLMTTGTLFRRILQYADQTPPPFIVEKLRETSRGLSTNSTPGPDGVPNAILSHMTREHLDDLLKI